MIFVKVFVMMSRISRSTSSSLPDLPIFRFAMPIPRIKASMSPVMTSKTGGYFDDQERVIRIYVGNGTRKGLDKVGQDGNAEEVGNVTGQDS